MKKVFSAMLLTAAMGVSAQNVQLHYDFGKANDKRANDRQHLTATVEFFKPDKWGDTFFFVDFDFNGDSNGVSLSYMEIARNQKIAENFPVNLHLEYNGGHYGASGFGTSFKNIFLVGGHYNLKLTENFSLGTVLAYKYNHGVKNGPDFQATVFWYKPFGKKFLFTGFADLWTEDNTGISFMEQPNGKKFVFLTEPQLWCSINKHFRIGTEIEISNKFVQNSNRLEINPTIGLRWEIQ